MVLDIEAEAAAGPRDEPHPINEHERTCPDCMRVIAEERAAAGPRDGLADTCDGCGASVLSTRHFEGCPEAAAGPRDEGLRALRQVVDVLDQDRQTALNTRYVVLLDAVRAALAKASDR
jgi:hypothetical protein